MTQRVHREEKRKPGGSGEGSTEPALSELEIDVILAYPLVPGSLISYFSESMMLRRSCGRAGREGRVERTRRSSEGVTVETSSWWFSTSF